MGCHFLFQRGLPNPEIKPTSPCLLPCRKILYHWATGENTHLYWMVRTPQNCQRHQKFKSLKHICSQKREPEETWQLNVMWFLDETLKQERTLYSQRIQNKIEALVFLFFFFYFKQRQTATCRLIRMCLESWKLGYPSFFYNRTLRACVQVLAGEHAFCIPSTQEWSSSIWEGGPSVQRWEGHTGSEETGRSPT